MAAKRGPKCDSVLEPVSDPILGRFWDDFGTSLVDFLVRFGVGLARFWGRFWTLSKPSFGEDFQRIFDVFRGASGPSGPHGPLGPGYPGAPGGERSERASEASERAERGSERGVGKVL